MQFNFYLPQMYKLLLRFVFYKCYYVMYTFYIVFVIMYCIFFETKNEKWKKKSIKYNYYLSIYLSPEIVNNIIWSYRMYFFLSKGTLNYNQAYSVSNTSILDARKKYNNIHFQFSSCLPYGYSVDCIMSTCLCNTCHFIFVTNEWFCFICKFVIFETVEAIKGFSIFCTVRFLIFFNQGISSTT